ncbi:unnamed protein product [Ilex paraguariensis]|uniref:Style cell-cycle inhibitor 1-A n=1 Tax=Ilex paraguariensis TaxID=185542 RepID=A0ABC8TFA5_9AQUA
MGWDYGRHTHTRLTQRVTTLESVLTLKRKNEGVGVIGSDRKMGEEEEKRKKKKKRSSLSPSEDEGKSKRRRTVEDKETKRNKKDKSQSKDRKKQHHKSHKSSKHHSDKGKKSDEKHIGKRHKHDPHLKVNRQELSEDDYFSKNNEFATWLKEEKNLFFSDLSSESARDLFSRFVKDWNNQKLESQYYEGISTGPRTSHKWKIKQ